MEEQGDPGRRAAVELTVACWWQQADEGSTSRPGEGLGLEMDVHVQQPILWASSGNIWQHPTLWLHRPAAYCLPSSHAACPPSAAPRLEEPIRCTLALQVDGTCRCRPAITYMLPPNLYLRLRLQDAAPRPPHVLRFTLFRTLYSNRLSSSRRCSRIPQAL